jgi:hypothetical protein
MTPSRHFSAALVTLVLLLAAHHGRASDARMELDFASNSRLLDQSFGRYGTRPAASISREAYGVRFRVSPQARGAGEIGLYSYFALAGDFEVEVSYELIAPLRKGGREASFGVVVDTEGPDGSLALARGHSSSDGSGYVVTRAWPSHTGKRSETNHHPTQSRRGRLCLQRQGADVLCLVADGPRDPFHEIGRVAFTDGTVRKVRFFADPAGTAVVDGRLAAIRVRAEEITGGIPAREASRWVGWWLVGWSSLCSVLRFCAW